MATSWPSAARTAYAADKGLTTTLAQALIDRPKVLLRHSFCLYFPEASTASTSPVTLYDWNYYIHSALSGKTINIYVNAKVTTGTGQLALHIGSVTEAYTDVTATDYTKTGPLTYVMPTGTYDTPTSTAILLRAKAPTGGTIYAQGSPYLWCYFTD